MSRTTNTVETELRTKNSVKIKEGGKVHEEKRTTLYAHSARLQSLFQDHPSIDEMLSNDVFPWYKLIIVRDYCDVTSDV